MTDFKVYYNLKHLKPLILTMRDTELFSFPLRMKTKYSLINVAVQNVYSNT